jgi:hypothetical protein
MLRYPAEIFLLKVDSSPKEGRVLEVAMDDQMTSVTQLECDSHDVFLVVVIL